MGSIFEIIKAIQALKGFDNEMVKYFSLLQCIDDCWWL